MTYPLNLIVVKLFTFLAEKKYLKFLIPKYLHFFLKSTFLTYSTTEFLRSLLLRIVKTLSTAKISSPEIYEVDSLFGENKFSQNPYTLKLFF